MKSTGPGWAGFVAQEGVELFKERVTIVLNDAMYELFIGSILREIRRNCCEDMLDAAGKLLPIEVRVDEGTRAVVDPQPQPGYDLPRRLLETSVHGASLLVPRGGMDDTPGVGPQEPWAEMRSGRTAHSGKALWRALLRMRLHRDRGAISRGGKSCCGSQRVIKIIRELKGYLERRVSTAEVSPRTAATSRRVLGAAPLGLGAGDARRMPQRAGGRTIRHGTSRILGILVVANRIMRKSGSTGGGNGVRLGVPALVIFAACTPHTVAVSEPKPGHLLRTPFLSAGPAPQQSQTHQLQPFGALIKSIPSNQILPHISLHSYLRQPQVLCWKGSSPPSSRGCGLPSADGILP